MNSSFLPPPNSYLVRLVSVNHYYQQKNIYNQKYFMVLNNLQSVENRGERIDQTFPFSHLHFSPLGPSFKYPAKCGKSEGKDQPHLSFFLLILISPALRPYLKNKKKNMQSVENSRNTVNHKNSFSCTPFHLSRPKPLILNKLQNVENCRKTINQNIRFSYSPF